MPDSRPRLLILGGTATAVRLAYALAARGHDAIYSLAGVTARPTAVPLPVRVGGFGGAAALAGHLRAERISHLIDATHPFATTMSANAARAAREAGVALVRLQRPEWRPVAGDRWIGVADTHTAAQAVARLGRRPFLSLGARGLDPFRAVLAARPALIRAIAPPPCRPAFSRAHWLFDRGPFERGRERHLLRRHAIGVLVARNSGGAASYAKVQAARDLRLPVVMIARPPDPPGQALASVAAVLAWLDAAGAAWIP